MGNKVGTKKYSVLYLRDLTIMNIQISCGLDHTHTRSVLPCTEMDRQDRTSKPLICTKN
jgi:hypothetical protein